MWLAQTGWRDHPFHSRPSRTWTYLDLGEYGRYHVLVLFWPCFVLFGRFYYVVRPPTGDHPQEPGVACSTQCCSSAVVLYVVRASNMCLLHRSPVKPSHCPVLEGRCRTVHGTFVRLLPSCPNPNPNPNGSNGTKRRRREENGALGHGTSDWLVRMAKKPGHALGGGRQDRAGAGPVEGAALGPDRTLPVVGAWCLALAALRSP